MDLNLNDLPKLKKGDKVWFLNNKKAFTVRACNDRFAICTQPYNFRPQTVVYTIIDFERNVRGLDNFVFGKYDYYYDEEYKEAILRIWEIHQYIKPEFSCTLCKTKVNPPTCQGCPIYCQTFSLD